MRFIVQNIWWILGIGSVVLIGGGWWFISSGLWHRFMDWVRPDSAKYVSAKFACEDRHVRDRKLKVDVYCITYDKKQQGYYLPHDFQLTNAKTGKQFLFLTERDSFPIDLFGKLTAAERGQYPTAQEIYINTANDADNKQSSDATRNMMGMSLSIVVLAGALIVVILGIIVFWQGRM